MQPDLDPQWLKRQLVTGHFNPLPHNPVFKQPLERNLMNTLLEKEKISVLIFFLFFNVFYSFQNKYPVFHHIYFVVCEFFQIWIGLRLIFGKGLRVNPFPHKWVLRGSVVKCSTRNPWVLGSSRTGSFGFFCGSVLGQDTSEPSLVLVKPRKT